MSAPRHPGPALRALLGLCAALALSACLLTAPTPRLTEADLQPILGDKTLAFTAFNRKGGAWVAADLAAVILIPEGRHYLMHDPEKPDGDVPAIRVGFLPLPGGGHLAEFVTPTAANAEQSFYGTARWDGQELLLGLIGCDDLRNRRDIADLVLFDNDDCTLLPFAGNPAAAAARLFQGLPPADTRLLRQP